METESNRAKQTLFVEKHGIKVCPRCGHDKFKKRPGIHLGQQMVCANCETFFWTPETQSANSTSFEEHSHGDAESHGNSGEVVVVAPHYEERHYNARHYNGRHYHGRRPNGRHH